MASEEAGFSLLELLLVMALIGILLSFALPAWQQHQWVAGRQQAWLQLQRIGLQQEMRHLQHGAYFNDMALVTLAAQTSAYDYQIQLFDTTYVLTATAKSNGAQAYDVACQRLTLSADGAVNSYGSGGESRDCK